MVQISSRNTLPSDSAVKVDDASVVLSSSIDKGSVTASVLSNVLAEEVTSCLLCVCVGLGIMMLPLFHFPARFRWHGQIYFPNMCALAYTYASLCT
jgi:hypothetical protein